MSATIGVDVGATWIRGVLLDGAGEVIARESLPTPVQASAVDVLEAIVGCVHALDGPHDAAVTSLGVGAPGWVSHDRRRIHYSPNLPWRDEHLADRLEARLGMAVVVENDANAAAWGELRMGAGQDKESLVLFTLGSGVGGAIIVNGRLVRGAHGVAGEIGHCPVDTDGIECTCGRTGCAENYCSGRAVMRASRLESPDLLLTAARRGDTDAMGLYERLGHNLARVIASTVLTVDPEVVVLGGGLVEAFDLVGPAVESSLASELGQWADCAPPFVAAKLGSLAGVLGAALLAREA